MTMVFNVAIRTVLINAGSGIATYRASSHSWFPVCGASSGYG
jgi:hypothetical protein